jgi:hypothetical protein
MPCPVGGDPTWHLRSGIKKEERVQSGLRVHSETVVHRLLCFLCSVLIVFRFSDRILSNKWFQSKVRWLEARQEMATGRAEPRMTT